MAESRGGRRGRSSYPRARSGRSAYPRARSGRSASQRSGSDHGGGDDEPRHGGRSCYICGKSGHIATNCYQRPTLDRRGDERGSWDGDCSQGSGIEHGNGWSGGRGPTCYVCGERGHLSKDCYKRVGFDHDNGEREGGGRSCYICGKSGHLARDCYHRAASSYGGPRGRGGQRASRSVCGQRGHQSSDCHQRVPSGWDQAPPGGRGSGSGLCYRHRVVGHSAWDCPRGDDEERGESPPLDGEDISRYTEEIMSTRFYDFNVDSWRFASEQPIVTETGPSSCKVEEGKEVEHARSTGSTNVEVGKKDDKGDEEDDECCILDYNPFEHPTTDSEQGPSVANSHPLKPQDEDVCVISERGQVACRDYPHSRHLCSNYPFNKTDHESYCAQCYCYVCDVVAPCEYWEGSCGHCHASDCEGKWGTLRLFQRLVLAGKFDHLLDKSSSN